MPIRSAELLSEACASPRGSSDVGLLIVSPLLDCLCETASHRSGPARRRPRALADSRPIPDEDHPMSGNDRADANDVDRRVRRTRDAILTAFGALIHGRTRRYAEIRVADIVGGADVGRST